jgi:hypothetical protein
MEPPPAGAGRIDAEGLVADGMHWERLEAGG